MDKISLRKRPPVWNCKTWAELIVDSAELLVIHRYISPKTHEQIKNKLIKQFKSGSEQ